MKLDHALKQDSGYEWVMSRLEPVSSFGTALARNPQWYGPGREADLNGELDRIARAVEGDWDAVIHLLSQFRDIRNSFHRQTSAPMDLVELFEVKYFLLHLELLSQVYEPLALPGIALPDLSDMLNLLDPSGRRLAPFHIETAFDPALERIRREKEQIELLLRNGQTEALLEQRQELVRQEDAAELNARRRLTAALLRERARFEETMDALGHLDLVLAKTKLAKKFRCARPEIGSDAVIAQDMIHPQVADHLSGDFTPVSLRLERGSTVVTGANMGGKSVSLKAVTLNLLLMHTGFFVFAGGLTSPLFHSVGLIGTDGQSVERGLSSFAAEVKQLDEILKWEGSEFFFLALDEFARGTNPREGAALARALAGHLNRLNCVALMTTHYDGVAAAAKRHYQVSGLDEQARKIDYRLILSPPDAPCPQDAIKICRLLDLDRELMAAFEKND